MINEKKYKHNTKGPFDYLYFGPFLAGTVSTLFKLPKEIRTGIVPILNRTRPGTKLDKLN